MIEYKTPYRIISLILASLIILTSFNYSVNLHYCQNSLAGISLFKTTTSCSKDSKSLCASKAKAQSSDDKKNCCHNEKVQIEDLDVDYTSSMVVEFVDIVFSHHTPSDVTPLLQDFSPEFKSYTSYKPPPLPDIGFQILYQAFLI